MSYSKSNPYFAKIKERFRLTLPGSSKQTHHIVVDLGDSAITYNVGDSLAIFPENHPDVIEKTLQFIEGELEALVVGKKTGESLPFLKFLKTKANLRTVNKKLADFIQAPEMTREELAQFEVWDFFRNLRKNKKWLLKTFAIFLCHCFLDFIPSHPLQNFFPNEIHLTVAPVHYHTRGQLRFGVATDFLCYQAEVERTPIGIYVQPHHGLPSLMKTM